MPRVDRKFHMPAFDHQKDREDPWHMRWGSCHLACRMPGFYLRMPYRMQVSYLQKLPMQESSHQRRRPLTVSCPQRLSHTGWAFCRFVRQPAIGSTTIHFMAFSTLTAYGLGVCPKRTAGVLPPIKAGVCPPYRKNQPVFGIRRKLYLPSRDAWLWHRRTD